MKRKIGELYGKPIVEGEENELTINEIKVTKNDEKKITLYARNGNKVENITSGSIQEGAGNYNPDFMRIVTEDDVIKQYNITSKEVTEPLELLIVSGQGICDCLMSTLGQIPRMVASKLEKLGTSITFQHGVKVVAHCSGHRDNYNEPLLRPCSSRGVYWIASQDNEEFAKLFCTAEMENLVIQEVPYEGHLDFYVNVAPIYPQDFEAFFNSLDQNSLT